MVCKKLRLRTPSSQRALLRSFQPRTLEAPALRRCSSSQKISATALIFREPLGTSFFSMEKRSQKPSKGGTPFDNPRRPWFRQLQLTRIYHWPSCVRPAREHAIYRASPSNAETEPEDFTRWYTSVVCCPASRQSSLGLIFLYTKYTPALSLLVKANEALFAATQEPPFPQQFRRVTGSRPAPGFFPNTQSAAASAQSRAQPYMQT